MRRLVCRGASKSAGTHSFFAGHMQVLKTTVGHGGPHDQTQPWPEQIREKETGAGMGPCATKPALPMDMRTSSFKSMLREGPAEFPPSSPPYSRMSKERKRQRQGKGLWLHVGPLGLADDAAQQHVANGVDFTTFGAKSFVGTRPRGHRQA